MAYILTKSNGQKLATIVDGSIDKTTTDLTFVGKNYAGYGEILNQNLVKLLENFASNTAPIHPVAGQLWYDSSIKKLKLYNGTGTSGFRAVPTFESSAQGAESRINTKGDFWYDETERKLKLWDGVKFITIGPYDSEFSGVALIPTTAVDRNGQTNYILKFSIDDGTGDNKIVGIVARDPFTVNSNDPLSNQSISNIKQGFSLPGADSVGNSTNVNAGGGYYFWGTAGTALGFVQSSDGVYHQAEEYALLTDVNGRLNYGLSIPDDRGLSVADKFKFYVDSSSEPPHGKISGAALSVIDIDILDNDVLKNVVSFNKNSVVPNTAYGINLGTSASRFSTSWVTTATSYVSNSTYSYANTFTGQLIGNVTGNVTGRHFGNVLADVVTATTFVGNMTGSISGNVVTSLITATGDDVTSAGKLKGAWTLVTGSTLEASYADLAERYAADALYGPGTVLVIGGANEVTMTAERASVAVAGIVSLNPAFKMNSEAGNAETHPYIALKGRVPCKVVGPIVKGELLVTSRRAGYAEAAQTGDSPNAVIGKALEDFKGSDGIIEVKV